MTIKGSIASKKGHVTKIDKVSLGVLSRPNYHLTRQIWWNLMQTQLRNQPGQGLAFLWPLTLTWKTLKVKVIVLVIKQNLGARSTFKWKFYFIIFFSSIDKGPMTI